MNEAFLSNEAEYSIFKYGETTIRFRAPYSLEYYTEVKDWDEGYLVVMAKYKHNSMPEEDYIDLIPILEDLYINPSEFISSIMKVSVFYG